MKKTLWANATRAEETTEGIHDTAWLEEARRIWSGDLRAVLADAAAMDMAQECIIKPYIDLFDP